MRVERKIVGTDVFGGLGVGGVIQQDRAQDGLLRVDVRGQSGIQSEIGDGGHRDECRAIPGSRLGVNRSALLWESGRIGIAARIGTLPDTGIRFWL